MPTEIPHLGFVTKDSEFDWYRSKPIAVKALGGKECCIVVEEYDQDEFRDQFHDTISNFLSIDENALREVESDLVAYYEDVLRAVGEEEPDFPRISAPDDVWKHIRFGNEPIVSRRPYGDQGVYVSVECECDWEPEHGLQIIFRSGRIVSKVGPYDGHLSNADAFADPRLEDVVYRRIW